MGSEGRDVDMKPDVDTATRLAFERTRVAYERTMLAWVRTASSLITFGFAIYKFFQLEVGGGERPDRFIGPREFSADAGRVSVCCGLCWRRWNTAGIFGALAEQGAEHRRSLSFIAAAVTAVLGVLALAAMAFRQ